MPKDVNLKDPKYRYLKRQGLSDQDIYRGHNRTAAPAGVRKKTEKLISEGKDPDQAYATAFSMHRAGRLTKRGRYIRKGDK